MQAISASEQLVFLDGFIAPFFKAAALVFPGVKGRCEQIELNRAECKREGHITLKERFARANNVRSKLGMLSKVASERSARENGDA